MVQAKYEWQAGWGSTIFYGDIGGTSRHGTNISFLPGTDLSTIKPAYSVGLKRNYKGNWAARINLLFSSLEGTDFNAADPSRRSRNLSFYTPIIETSLKAEYKIVNFLKKNNKGMALDYYVFAGLGGTYFNPKAEYNREWVALRKLGTEGQGLISGKDFYKPVTLVMPYGAGLRYNYGLNYFIFAELTVHQAFTDYLDDVSTNYYDYNALYQARGATAANLSFRSGDSEYPTNKGRGNPGSKDMYITFRLGVSRIIGKTKINDVLDLDYVEECNKF